MAYNKLNKNKNINFQQINKILKQEIGFLKVIVLLILIGSGILILASSTLISQMDLDMVATAYKTAPNPPRASLYLSPRKINCRVGDEFIVNVIINTKGSNVVASAAYLSFNPKQMKVLGVDVSNSVLNMVAEKKIDNKNGKIKITLGKPTPGINIAYGKMAVIRFKAISPTKPFTDNISFDFTRGSSLYSTVILDDKMGTNILSSTRGARVFIEK